jgi:phosphoribosylcarboxyaminoimidazole (NCAIR) mutase
MLQEFWSSMATLPVFDVPIAAPVLGSPHSALSMVQMPAGTPVGIAAFGKKTSNSKEYNHASLQRYSTQPSW